MNNKYDLISYKKEKELTSLDIKKMMFNSKNQTTLYKFIQDTSDSKTFTLNNKAIEVKQSKEILTAYTNRIFIDLSKDTITEDVLFNRIKSGYKVEVKNNFDIYTFQVDDDITYFTINADREHSYFMKKSYTDFGRANGEVDPKFKSFDAIIGLAIDRTPTKLERLQSNIDDNLNALANKLDSPETQKTINKYLKQMSAFHNYSFNNQMLLAITADDRNMSLERVASFNTWKKLKDADGNHARIMKGQKGLPVIVPINYTKYKRDDSGNYIMSGGHKIPIIDPDTNKPETGLKFGGGFVFDISQLENADAIRETLALQYRDKNTDIEDIVVENLIKDISHRYDVLIRYEDIQSGANAYYSLDKDEIVLSTKIDSNSHKISSLFHELGHKIMHSDIPYEEIHKDRGAIEGEAEAFSKILSNLYGIDNQSELYISTWGNSGQDLRDKLEKISTVAMETIKTLGLDTLQKSISDVSYQQSQEKKSDNPERKPIEAIAQSAKIQMDTASSKKRGYEDVAV